jgi:Pyridoxamine 5'-phosphate oxidase
MARTSLAARRCRSVPVRSGSFRTFWRVIRCASYTTKHSRRVRGWFHASRCSAMGEPVAPSSRPHMPGYGVPRTKKGLLPWSHLVERLEAAPHYWVATASRSGRPRARPIDGVVVDGCLYFSGGEVGWVRDLRANPRISVHLESADDVVIIDRPPPSRARRAHQLGEQGAPRLGHRSLLAAGARGGVCVDEHQEGRHPLDRRVVA